MYLNEESLYVQYRGNKELITEEEVDDFIDDLYCNNRRIIHLLLIEIDLNKIRPMFLFQRIMLKCIKESDAHLAYLIVRKVNDADRVDIKNWYDFKKYELKLEPLAVAGKLLVNTI